MEKWEGGRRARAGPPGRRADVARQPRTPVPTHMGATIVVHVRKARLCSDDQTGNRPGLKVELDS